MNILKQLKKLYIYVILSIVVIFCTSCTNLNAVSEWSKTSLEATQYNELVATYVDTPERLKRYDPDHKEDWDNQSSQRKKQAEALSKLLSIVTDYMTALAILSADSTVDYNKDVDLLTTEIEKLDAGVSKETLGAAGSLAKTVLNASAKAYQAKQVALIVEQANKPLQAILKGELRKIVDKDFRRDLESEKSFIEGFYDHLSRTGNPSDAAKDAVKEWKEVRIQQNDKRFKTVDAYLKILDTVADGHQKLCNNKDKLDRKTLIKDLYSLISELRKQIKILAT